MNCACCGKSQGDDHPLFNCTACYLVRYCGVECQKKHWKKHKRECKKRAAELRDEMLFKQPESTHLGDCPICMVPLPLHPKQCMTYACCSKFVCNGCIYDMEENAQKRKCPFCREALNDKDDGTKGINEQRMKRVEANDPVALIYEGSLQLNKGNYTEAFGYYTKVAERDGLGAAEAHYRLSNMYRKGHGVEKDEQKMNIHHLEFAAIGGHAFARSSLGAHEWKNGNKERAVKHWIIAATQGDDRSMEALSLAHKGGIVEEDVLSAVQRAHKAAVDETKTPGRNAAVKYFENILP
eukprot:scaffold5342_cov83-Skeletonema_menzelii.AAC.2